MRLLKWLAIAAVLFIQPAFGHTNNNIPQPIVDYYQESVWSVDSILGGGSAFHISPTFLITNKHVVVAMGNSAAFLTRNTFSGRMPVEVVAVSDVYDLALLYCALCAGMTPTLLTIEDHWFDIGEETWGGGYGYGTLGIHRGYTQSFDYRYYMQVVDTPAQPGDSGSPQIIVEEDGSFRLVGVRTMGNQSYMLLEPAGAVAGFLRRLGFNF